LKKRPPETRNEEMSRPDRLSPRQEALDAILATSAAAADSTIDATTWDRLVALAWDNRAYAGDRREIRREIRAILLDSTRDGSGDATD
jgi:hypothetical protein